MERKNSKIKLKLNDANNLRELLQETYNLADFQITQAQQEIAKLSSATNLGECIMEEKGKYAKAINDFLMVKDKAISKKMDIAKLMSEVLKYNGNVNDALATAQTKEIKVDFDKIRQMIDDEQNEKKAQIVELNKDIKNK